MKIKTETYLFRPRLSAGDTVGVEIDGPKKRIRFLTKNNGEIQTHPYRNIPFDIQNGAIYPIALVFGSGVENELKMNFGQEKFKLK